MRKRLLPIVAAFAALSLILTGCNSTNGGTDEPDKTTTAQSTDKPAENLASSEYQWGNVKIVGGGYTSGIYYNETEEGLVYARTDVGGAYRMDKETGKWIPLTDQFDRSTYSLYGIDGLVTDPVEPNKVYLLAGMYTNGWLEMPNACLLRSEDYGETWERVDLEFPTGGNEPNRFCDRLVMDPNDNNTLYIGSRKNGLWVSHDAGKTWAQVTSFPTLGIKYTEDSYSFGILTIAFDKSSGKAGEGSKTIYVGTGDKVVYYSQDAGETWKEVPNQPTSYLSGHIYCVDDYVYIVANDKAGPYQVGTGAIRRYNPKTEEWDKITPDAAGHGWGDIAFDPENHSIIYASTMGKWGGEENDCIYRTTDGGTNWAPLFTGDGVDKIFEVKYDEAPWLDWGNDNAKLGWMMGCLAINPFNGNEMMYGTGATIMCSENLTKWGDETIVFNVKCDGLEETVISDLCAVKDSDDVVLYSAMGDVDGFSHKDVTKVPENLNNNGSIGSSESIDCAFNNPSFVVRCGGGQVELSTDSGKTWSVITPKEAKGDGGEVSVNCDGTAIYYTTKNSAAVFVTTDSGETWEKCGKAFAGPQIETDHFDPKTVYFNASSTLYISRDMGKTVELCKSVIMPESTTMCASPEEEGVLWLASKFSGICKVTEFGSKLTEVGKGSAHIMCFGAAKEGNDHMTMYSIGLFNGAFGVYRSLDNGVTWERINDDNHQFGSIGDTLAADYNVYGRVYFGTNGRGIIMGNVK